MICNICPRGCSVDRTEAHGYCGCGSEPKVARISLHHWEEPPISGVNGSGTVFFSGCNLKCAFCQNYLLRDGKVGVTLTAERLADAYLYLESVGAHNINLVTAGPHLNSVIESIHISRSKGLRIPFVYNSNGYESVQSIRRLDGLIDIYLPDFKYVSSVLSARLSNASDYFQVALPCLLEMYRQVGRIVTDSDGIAQRGMIIRHLVLPGCLDDSRSVLRTVSENFPSDIHLSLMGQYCPVGSDLPSVLMRRLTKREYDRIIEYCINLGFTKILIQDLSSATLEYTPNFLEPLPSF